MRVRTGKPRWQQKIAKERIQILFDLAEKEFKKHPERSKRYVELARKIGLRYNIRFPKELKRKFCKNCNSLLIPGYSSQVRIKSEKKVLEVKCLNCKKIYRYPYK
jgi:ribonuclease P protein subunit RPR2